MKKKHYIILIITSFIISGFASNLEGTDYVIKGFVHCNSTPCLQVAVDLYNGSSYMDTKDTKDKGQFIHEYTGIPNDTIFFTFKKAIFNNGECQSIKRQFVLPEISIWNLKSYLPSYKHPVLFSEKPLNLNCGNSSTIYVKEKNK